MIASEGTEVADDTLFRIYSMTKPVTSVALMQLYERGMFQLNDPVYRVLPEWRNQQVYVSGSGAQMKTEPLAQPMTFRHLLSHTAGLSYGGIFAANSTDVHPVDALYEAERTFRGPESTLEGLVQHLANVPLRYQPGTKWMYSVATDICGLVVERLSGQKLDDYFEGAHPGAAGDARHSFLGGRRFGIALRGQLRARCRQDSDSD